MEREVITEEQINRIFSKELTLDEISHIGERITTHPDAKYMIYYHKNSPRANKIPMMIRPRVIRACQLKYYHEVGLEIIRAFKKILPLYLASGNPPRKGTDETKELFQFTEDEKEWLEDIYRDPSFAKNIGKNYNDGPVIARLDSNASFQNPVPEDSFKLFEINGVAIGAVYFEATIESIIRDVVMPTLTKIDPKLTLINTPDGRHLLINDILSHARTLGYTNPNIGFLEDKKDMYGTREYSYFVPYYKRMGYNVFRVDPRELYLKDGRICYRDESLDVIYRDCEISDLIRLQKKDRKISILKKYFATNQIISSIVGEFDHKGAFELFSNAKLARYFSARQRELFKRHVLWTRVIRETMTTDPYGKEIDLVKYILNNKESLLIKPNRGLGGSGIKLGLSLTNREWEESVDDALKFPSSQVVQSLSTVVTERFPVLNKNKNLVFDDLYTDAGFVITKGGIGILSRVSKDKVVNIARGGGMCAVVVVK